MKLDELLRDFFEVDQTFKHINITGLANDTRNVKEGDLFFFEQGETFDPHSKFKEVEAVAAAFICERPMKTDKPCFVVPKVNEVLGPIAARFYGNDSSPLVNIGVTGTNGKTSVATIISHLLRDRGAKIGTIGTTGIYVDGKQIMKDSKTPTSPPPLELQQIMNDFNQRGAGYNVMEVSSHAMKLNRTKGSSFKYRIFTNITLDHLDFHRTFEDYLKSKSMLFQQAKANEFSIINRDMDHFNDVKENNNGVLVTYGIDKNSDYQAKDVSYSSSGVSFVLQHQNERVRIQSHLIGKFNVYNLLASIVVAHKEGMSFEEIQASIQQFYGIPGRLEKVPGAKTNVFVDYAHTPDALENVLETVQAFRTRHIITVFGCGGDRDRSKRPLMGSVAEKFSDQVIVTADNPRTEDQHQITLDIEKGLTGEYIYEPDRDAAIKKAIELADKEDIVLIAGKGHEDYQIIGNKKIHFDDVEVARKYLA